MNLSYRASYEDFLAKSSAGLKPMLTSGIIANLQNANIENMKTDNGLVTTKDSRFEGLEDRYTKEKSLEPAVSLVFCHICNFKASSEKTLQVHIKGMAHIKRQNLADQGNEKMTNSMAPILNKREELNEL